MMGEIRYNKAILSECCLRVAKQVPRPFSDCLLEIYKEKRTAKGRHFGEVARPKLMQYLKKLPISDTERELFIHSFSGGGFEEERMQLSVLEQGARSLEKQIGELELRVREQGRVALGLGVLGGVFLVVILL